MTLIALLVLVLIVLAGGIAYLGDRLGAYVGRRRLSLFGARPRTTGAIVGVVAGILIMLTTIGVLALAFQNATRTLLNVQRTLDELNQLRAQQRVLDQRVIDANVQLEDLRSELELAQDTIATAEDQRDAAVSARDAAFAEREELSAQRDELQLQVDEARAVVDAAAQEVAASESRLAEAQAELASVGAALSAAQAERDQALADTETARQAALAAQAEAVEMEREAEEARAQLESANLQLSGMQASLEVVAERLAVAEQQVVSAQTALDAAEAARQEAEAAREQALADQASALAERDAAVQESAALSERLTTLNAEVSELERTTDVMRQQAQALQAENALLAEGNRTLAEDNARIQQQNVSLAEFNDRLEEEIRQRNLTVQELQAAVDDLQRDVERQARDLADLQQDYQRFEGGEVYFVKDQLIYSGAIHAQDPAAVRDELASFIADATVFVARRGVERIRVTPEQVNMLVDVITQTPGSDLIRLISPSNQISSTIDVLVEALENNELFGQGQLIVSHPVHLGTPELPASQDEIRASIAQLKAEALRKLRRAGLDDGQLPDFGPVTEELFMNMLLRLTGPVTIGLVATEPVLRAGPANLELLILY